VVVEVLSDNTVLELELDEDVETVERNVVVVMAAVVVVVVVEVVVVAMFEGLVVVASGGSVVAPPRVLSMVRVNAGKLKRAKSTSTQ
jgi:hypothetical protein